MSVTITTFGYTLRDDEPEAAIVADVRDIPGIVVAGHEDSNGLDPDVQESVMGSVRAREHRDELLDLIADADHDTTVAIGCYQGRHRSVALAEVIAQALRDDGHTATTEHLDLDTSTAEQAADRPGGRMAHSPNRYWGDTTPVKDKAKFFNAVTTPVAGDADGATVATIRMYGPIDSWGGWWGISTNDISQVIDSLPDSVTSIVLRINSPGGEVSEAIAILNMLRAHRASVTAVVDGIAASAASVIAAGCDDVVMSPGTRMMIHSPWTYASGNASELRKAAMTLDSFESSLVEIYEAKAGEQDWGALLAEETWLNSQEAVDLGLADRVEVVPDAGVTETAGESDPFDDHDFNDATPQRVASLLTPAASASGSTTGKEKAVAFTPDQLTKMRADLGLAPDADETAIASAVAARPAPALPEGIVTIDASALATLQHNAQAGVQALENQRIADRDRYLDRAIERGKFAAARRENFQKLYDADPEGTKDLIDGLAENTIPVIELGYDAGDTVAKTEDDRTYDAVFPSTTTEGA